MGVVYKAEQTELGRIVALKTILNQDAAQDATLVRFQREARAVARLRHPGIVPIHEIGAIEGRHYFTMDYIDGKDLDRLLDRGPLPPKRAIEIARDIARAVQYAHDQGIIHRDLKPSNILVDRTGAVFVTDFGLAKDLQSDHAKITLSGEVLGTPTYMAPERVQSGGTVGPSCDVYSTGALLYRLLTGRPPFDGPAPADILLRVLGTEPTPPRRLHSTIPRDAETLCLKAMDKEAHRRYASAGALAEDCDRFLRGEPIQARAVGRFVRTVRTLRRHPRLVAAMGAAVLALGIWILVGTVRRTFSVRNDLASAAELERQGDLRDADALFRRVLAADPRNQTALAGVHRILEAEEEAQRLFEAGRNAIEAALLYQSEPGFSYDRFVARLRPARLYLDRGLAKVPHSPVGHYLLGRTWELEGAEQAAERSWREALARDPQLGPAHYQLGRLLLLRAYQSTLLYEGGDRFQHLKEAGQWAEESLQELEAAFAKGSGFDDELQRDIASVLILLTRNDLSSVRIRTHAFLDRPDSRGKEEFYWLLGLASAGSAAIDAFTQALTLRPQHWLARYDRGLERRKQCDWDGAIEDFTEVIRVRPRFSKVHLNRGVCWKRKGDLDRALADYEQALACDQTFAAAYANRSEIRLERGDFDGAIGDCTEALRLAPTLIWAYVNRAVAWLQKGAYQPALEDCDAVLRIQPSFAPAYHNRGLIRKKMEDVEEAIADHAEATRIDPRYLEAWIGWGYALLQKGRYSEVVSVCTRALEVFPNEVRLYHNRGEARRRSEEWEGAISDFGEVLRRESTTVDAYIGRAFARQETGDLRGAKADLVGAVQLDPKNLETHVRLAEVGNAAGDYAEAAQAAGIALALSSESTRAWIARGFSRMRTADLPGAIADFTECLRIQPDSFGAYLFRGVARCDFADLPGGIQDFSEALKLNPSSAPAYYNRGRARARTGDLSGAMEDLESAVRLADPNWPLLESAKQELRKYRKRTP